MLNCFDEKYTRVGLSDSFSTKICGKEHVMTFSDENTYTHSEACQPKGEKERKTNHLEKRNAANAATMSQYGNAGNVVFTPPNVNVMRR